MGTKAIIGIFGILGLLILVGRSTSVAPQQPAEKQTVLTEKQTTLANPVKPAISWDIDNSGFSKEDIQWFKVAAEKVLKDDKNCGSITDGNLNSTAGQKPYYVTCKGQGQIKVMYNVFFDKGDAIALKPLKAVEPFPTRESRTLCEVAIKRRAAHPSTVDIHSFMGYGTQIFGNGNRRIWQDFGAKNSFGLELTYTALCEFSPEGKLDITISEKR